jgi:hypothetical protein
VEYVVKLFKFQESFRNYLGIWIITFLGLLLRTYHYLRNPSIWHDEVATFLNVINKGFVGLLGPLYHSGTGPPLFLWTQKCIELCLGESTYALRLVPFLASCAALVVMAVVVSRLLGPVSAGASVLLVACSDKILWHAAEARPYSSDVLIASVLALLFIVSHKWTARRRALFFAGLAPFVISASYPGVFLLGGITIALVFVLIRQKQNAPTWLALIVLGVSIAGTFLILFLTTASAQRTTTLNAQWAYAFPDWRHPTHVPLWLIRATIDVFDYTMRPIGGILALAACIGAVSWWRAGERELIVFLVAPLALAAAAGLTHAYPYTGVRTMAFVMPALALLVGAGVQAARDWANGSQRRAWLAGAIIGLPILATLFLSLYRVCTPWRRADTAGAAAYVLEHRAGPEPVTANQWEYEYYFRNLDGMFYPKLRLLQEKTRPSRYWIVLTSDDLPYATTIADSLRNSQILERREFLKTTVMLIANDIN